MNRLADTVYVISILAVMYHVYRKYAEMDKSDLREYGILLLLFVAAFIPVTNTLAAVCWPFTNDKPKTPAEPTPRVSPRRR